MFRVLFLIAIELPRGHRLTRPLLRGGRHRKELRKGLPQATGRGQACLNRLLMNSKSGLLRLSAHPPAVLCQYRMVQILWSSDWGTVEGGMHV